MRCRLTLAVALACSPALAQSDAPHQPYAGMQARSVKALSDQQIDDLRAGRGMSLALAAELNGFPGPKHTLEYADRLGLTSEQRARTQALFDRMQEEAQAFGKRLIQEEAELDRLFATRAIEASQLDAATNSIGRIQGRLRATHLHYHLAMMDVLSPDQVNAYGRLRGYDESGAGGNEAPHRQQHGNHQP